MEEEITPLDHHDTSFSLLITFSSLRTYDPRTADTMTATIDLSFPSGSLTLEGSLTFATPPSGAAALLISGSGPIDRDSNSKRLAIDVMSQVAAHLAAAGIASLRYDKRGVGASDGSFHAAGFHDNVADSRAALDALRARPEVDPDRIVVIGHSEGALIASVLAGDEHLAGVALLAGSAHSGRDVLTWQARQIAPTLPTPARWLMRLFRQDLERTQAKRLARLAATTDDVVRIQFVKVNAKWFREFMSFEPAEALRRAELPVLAITGSKDLQVDPADVAAMERIVPGPFTGHVVDDVTHLLRAEAGPPSIRTYRKQARRPVDGRVMALVTDWVVAATRPTERDDDDRS
jgi:pimeloyl-ACP methyl ester carboxylesterase